MDIGGTTTAIVIGSIVFAVLITVVVIFFVWRTLRHASGDPKVLQTGRPARATIMSVEPTGMIVNNLYYQCNVGLRVQLDGGAPYDVYAKQLIPITSMAMLTPGTGVAVKVDQEDQSKVAIDWEQGITPAGAGGMAGGMGADPSASEIASAMAAGGGAGVTQGSAADLLRSGQRVAGVLTEFADTGNTARSMGITPSQPQFIDDPFYALTLQLHIPNTQPLEAKVIHRVPAATAPQLQMGMQLNCAVNPANPTREVAVDWGDTPV